MMCAIVFHVHLHVHVHVVPTHMRPPTQQSSLPPPFLRGLRGTRPHGENGEDLGGMDEAIQNDSRAFSNHPQKESCLLQAALVPWYCRRERGRKEL